MQRLHGQHRLSDVELGGLLLEHEPIATVLDTVQIAASGVFHHQIEVLSILESSVEGGHPVRAVRGGEDVALLHEERLLENVG